MKASFSFGRAVYVCVVVSGKEPRKRPENCVLIEKTGSQGLADQQCPESSGLSGNSCQSITTNRQLTTIERQSCPLAGRPAGIYERTAVPGISTAHAVVYRDGLLSSACRKCVRLTPRMSMRVEYHEIQHLALFARWHPQHCSSIPTCFPHDPTTRLYRL